MGVKNANPRRNGIYALNQVKRTERIMAKKIIKTVAACLISAVMIMGIVAISGCAKKSTAATIDDLMREDYAKEREAEDDAKGREHIEIPDGAATIEIDGEEWTVVRGLKDLFGSYNFRKNFIQANDIDLDKYSTNNRTFKGKYNGNNYKFYGDRKSELFRYTENAVIENVIFSSEDDEQRGISEILVNYAKNTTIKNVVNYWHPKYEYGKNARANMTCLIHVAKACVIENVVNFADFPRVRRGAIISATYGTTVKNCKNYGNLGANNDKYPCGAIVGGTCEGETVIENCENYGDLCGVSFFGGILGAINLETNELLGSRFDIKDASYYNEGIVVRNCKNYGNIYLNKGEDKKLEKTWNNRGTAVYGIGGIAGTAEKIENCENYGNFYGFENLGQDIKVDYCGGIAGVAKEVVNCTTENKIIVQKGRAKNVGEIYGYLVK